MQPPTATPRAFSTVRDVIPIPGLDRYQGCDTPSCNQRAIRPWALARPPVGASLRSGHQTDVDRCHATRGDVEFGTCGGDYGFSLRDLDDVGVRRVVTDVRRRERPWTRSIKFDTNDVLYRTYVLERIEAVENVGDILATAVFKVNHQNAADNIEWRLSGLALAVAIEIIPDVSLHCADTDDLYRSARRVVGCIRLS